jgi:hypothetical protein
MMNEQYFLKDQNEANKDKENEYKTKQQAGNGMQ